MDENNEIEKLVARLREAISGDFSPRFDDLSSKIQDLEDNINEALEVLNERRYAGDAKEYYEE